MAHKNQDIILLKLKELRQEELPQSALPILNSIEDLVKERPRLLLVPNDVTPNKPA